MAKERELERSEVNKKEQHTSLVLGRARGRYTSIDVRDKLGRAGVGDRAGGLVAETGCLLACGQPALRSS